jgi:hypothetical protein
MSQHQGSAAKAGGRGKLPPDVDAPIDVLNQHLAQAHAILDVLHVLLGSAPDERELEGLREGTLTNALYGALQHIEAAETAAGQVEAQRRAI